MEWNEIFSKVQLKEKVLHCGEQDFRISYSDDLDAMIDQMTNELFEEDERFPYFFAIWDSGVLLAEYLLDNLPSLQGKTVLELGAGTGVCGVALAVNSGCRVIFTDYEEYSCYLCQHNCEINGISNNLILTADWRNFPELTEPVHLVICSDVLYEKKQVNPLFQTVVPFLQRGIPVYLADPGRAHIEEFLSLIKNAGYTVERFQVKDSGKNGLPGGTTIFILTSL